MDVITFYRRLPRFDYVKPASIDDALALLGENNNGAYLVYAGGTNVIPNLKKRLINTPKVLMDLKGMPALDYVACDERNGLKIGALATIASVIQSSPVRKSFNVLFQGADSIAATQIQNQGTIAGNICDASPFADTLPALFVLDARLVSISKQGERVSDIEGFFPGRNKTILRSDELLKEIQIPNPPQGSGSVYLKFTPRKRMDISVLGVAALVRTENGVFKDVRIALNAVDPMPHRCRKAEDMLKGEKATDEAILKAANTASREAHPIDDYRASAEYRRTLIEVLVKRAVLQAMANQKLH